MQFCLSCEGDIKVILEKQAYRSRVSENTEYINRIHQHTSRALNVTSVCLEGMHDPGLQIDRNLSE